MIEKHHDIRKICRGKLGNGEHLSLEAYKYKENNIYVIIIKQHKEHIKFYPETHFHRHNLTSMDMKLWPIKEDGVVRPLPALPGVIANAF